MKRVHRSRQHSGLHPKFIGCRHLEVLGDIRSFLLKRHARGYVVGGMLRDSLEGRLSKDVDIVVEGVKPSLLAAHLHRRLGFSSPATFPRFGTTLTVRPDIQVEISRLEGSLLEDASRRDFTLNCLFADIAAMKGTITREAILDPTGRGLADLRAGLIRTPAEPSTTFWLDPLRVLRAIRFHAVLGFRLDRGLLRAIPRVVYLIKTVSPERIRLELERVLVSDRVLDSFRLMRNLGILGMVLPELDRTAGFSQATPYHAYDLFTHAVKTAAKTPPDLTLRLAALLHDVGKIDTRVYKKGRAVYYGHEESSAQAARSVLERLKFPRRLTKDVTFLVRNHMINYSKAWSNRAVRRLIRKMGPNLEPLLMLVDADRKAQRPDAGLGKTIADLRKRIKSLEMASAVDRGLPVTGDDIMAFLGLEEGPAVGRAKEFLFEEASKRRRPLTRQDCLSLLKMWWENRDRG